MLNFYIRWKRLTNYTALKQYFYSIMFLSNDTVILNSCMCCLSCEHDHSVKLGHSRAPLVILELRCLQLKATLFHWDCMEHYNSIKFHLHSTETCEMAYSACFGSDLSSLMKYFLSSSQGDQDDRSFKQYRTSSPSSAGSLGYGRYTPTSHSPQHYSRPGNWESSLLVLYIFPLLCLML